MGQNSSGGSGDKECYGRCANGEWKAKGIQQEKKIKIVFFYSRLLDLYFLQLYSLLYKAPPEEQEGQSEEEQLKQKTKERARKEFLGAVASEGKNNC